MNRWIKGIAWAVVALVVIIGVGVQLSARKMNRHIDVSIAPIAIPTDAAAIERGGYLFKTRGCSECHGKSGGGGDIAKDDSGLLLHSPNISPGAGSVVTGYRTEDWLRSIRHGIKPDGRPLMVMPSEDFVRLSDADVGALIAYTKQLAPVAGTASVIQLSLPLKVLYGFGVIPDAASQIDHTAPPPVAIPEGVTAAYGSYVAAACAGCHNPSLSGGKIASGPPDWPPAANLTPGAGTVLPRYADAQSLIAMFHSGKRPDGSIVSDVMPFASLKQMSDLDVQALYLYLKTLPPRNVGQR